MSIRTYLQGYFKSFSSRFYTFGFILMLKTRKNEEKNPPAARHIGSRSLKISPQTTSEAMTPGRRPDLSPGRRRSRRFSLSLSSGFVFLSHLRSLSPLCAPSDPDRLLRAAASAPPGCWAHLDSGHSTAGRSPVHAANMMLLGAGMPWRHHGAHWVIQERGCARQNKPRERERGANKSLSPINLSRWQNNNFNRQQKTLKLS